MTLAVGDFAFGHFAFEFGPKIVFVGGGRIGRDSGIFRGFFVVFRSENGDGGTSAGAAGWVVGKRFAIGGEGLHWDVDLLETGLELTAGIDEGRGAVVVRVVASELGAVHADLQVFADFEVEVDGVHAVVAAHGADELAFFDELSNLDFALMEMGVEAVDHVDFAGDVAVGVADDDAVSPADADVFGEDDDTAAHGVNGVAEVGVTATFAVPVLAKVAIGVEATEFVVAGGVGFADGEVKAVSEQAADGV